MKLMQRSLFFLLSLAVFLSLSASPCSAQGNRILFIPHDDRPISFHMHADIVEKTGDTVIVPPHELLGSWNSPGYPDELWKWLEENAPGCRTAIISTDSMIYGSLVASRKHDIPLETLLSRAKRFEQLHEKFPRLNIYSFSSIMRTPATSESSGNEDAAYYAKYGTDIFRYTALIDKRETDGLTKKEEKEYEQLDKKIPAEVLSDWMGRREKNYKVNEYLASLVNRQIFSYLILSLDDNAPYCQTHLEARHLKAVIQDPNPSHFAIMMGLDEDAILLMARAINNDKMNTPFIYTEYSDGTGANTIPTYCSEPIGKSIKDAIFACGGFPVPAPKNADLVLLVNTNFDGSTPEASSESNTIIPRPETNPFISRVERYVSAGYPVAIGDIAYGNGADNALMNQLKERNLLFAINSYGGWNTATNSIGFLIGESVLLPMMPEKDAKQLLITRYLDDWAYQANVRQMVWAKLEELPGKGNLSSLDDKKADAESFATEMMQKFATENILPASFWKNLKLTFPWNRTFEADYSF